MMVSTSKPSILTKSLAWLPCPIKSTTGNNLYCSSNKVTDNLLLQYYSTSNCIVEMSATTVVHCTVLLLVLINAGINVVILYVVLVGLPYCTVRFVLCFTSHGQVPKCTLRQC
jgi:hypothetical protein